MKTNKNMQNKRKFFTFYFLLFTFTLAWSVSAQQLTVKEIMKEPSIAGMRVAGERLSPDGKQVIYLWNAEGKNPRDLYMVSTSGETPKKILSPNDLIKKKEAKKKKDPLEYGVVVNDEFVQSRRNQIGNLRWSPDSSKFLFTQNGDIYVLKMGETKAKRITKTQSFEFSASFLDNDRILFQQSGNFFSIDTKNGTLTQISKEANRARRTSVFGSTPSKNGEMIAYISSNTSKSRPLFVPNYLPYYTAAPTVRRGWSRQKVYATMTDGSLEKAYEIKLPKQEGEAFIAGLKWLADNKTLIVDRIDKTHKRRQMFVVTFAGEKANVFKVHEEADEKWLGRISRIIEANPKNANQFFFSSEMKTGYNHLYLVNLDKAKFADGKANAETKQLTNGKWEVTWAKWSEDFMTEKSIINFVSTKANPQERTLSVIKEFNQTNSFKDLPLGKGMKTSFQMENRAIIFEGSKWNQPGELFAPYTVLDYSKQTDKNIPSKINYVN